MGVIMSITKELDGRRWLHASLSARTIDDAYDKLALLKRVWIGEGRTALQVFPPKAKHVNVHPNCLHLWACLDGDVTPDFSRGLGVV